VAKFPHQVHLTHTHTQNTGGLRSRERERHTQPTTLLVNANVFHPQFTLVECCALGNERKITQIKSIDHCTGYFSPFSFWRHTELWAPIGSCGEPRCGAESPQRESMGERERDRERASAFSTELTPRPSRGIIETSGRKKEATHTLGGVCVCVRVRVGGATFGGF
jgi:hypothetical protein